MPTQKVAEFCIKTRFAFDRLRVVNFLNLFAPWIFTDECLVALVAY